jgi:hypothetical protein
MERVPDLSELTPDEQYAAHIAAGESPEAADTIVAISTGEVSGDVVTEDAD